MPIPEELVQERNEQVSIVIDGRIEEDDWSRGEHVERFTVFRPVPDAEPASPTEAWILQDTRGFYAGFRVVDLNPKKLRAGLGRRDTPLNDDTVAVVLDPSGEGQRAYLFGANALGVPFDGILMADGGEDLAWDAAFRTAGRRTETGFEVEMFIPWNTVRHPKNCDAVGVILIRRDSRHGEQSAWPRIDPSVQGFLVQEERLQGPGVLPPRRGIAAVPELTFGWTEEGAATGRWGMSGVSPGGTVRFVPGPQTSILGTVNPDFSQVESDAARIDANLRYALQYEEKRPFFLEGQEWFDHPFGDLVYTRAFVTPRYGVRATAETGRWTVAAMNVLDATTPPTVSEGGGWTDDVVDERSSVATAARVRGAIGQDGYVGMLLSDRTIDGDVYNRVGGFDSRVRLSDKTVMTGSLLGSITGDGSGQFGGAGGTLEVGYDSERAFLWGGGQAISPGFRVENGFVTQADLAGAWVMGGYIWRTGLAAIPAVKFAPIDGFAAWTFDGQSRETKVNPYIGVLFANGMRASLTFLHRNENWEGAWLTYDRAKVSVGGTPTRWLDFGVDVSVGKAPFYETAEVGASERAYVSIDVTPVPWATLGWNVGAERFHFGDELVYAGFVNRARLDLYASRSLWARFVVDRDQFDDRTGAEALLAWQQGPRTGVYLGGAYGMTAEEPEWQVFAKVTVEVGE